MLFLVAAGTLPFAAFMDFVLTRANKRKGTVKFASMWYLSGLVPALLSPNFITGNVQAFVMLQRTESVIGEWKPSIHFLEIATTNSHLVCGLLPTTLLGVWAALTAWVWLSKVPERRTAWPFWRVLLALALIVLSMRSVRFVYISALALVVMGPLLAHVTAQIRMATRVGWISGALATLMLFLFAYESNVSCRLSTRCNASLVDVASEAFSSNHIDERRFPVEEADILESTGFRGSIFAQASWGGYLLYRLWPHVRVIADGRGNYDPEVAEDLALVYDPRVLGDVRNGPAFEDVYRRYQPDLVLQQQPWPVQTTDGRIRPVNSVRIGVTASGDELFHYRPHPKNWQPLRVKGKQPTMWFNMQSDNARAYRMQVYRTRGKTPQSTVRFH